MRNLLNLILRRCNHPVNVSWDIGRQRGL